MPDEPATAGDSTAHWGTKDPAAEPSGDVVATLPRLVMDVRSRLGSDAGVDKVLAELKERGLDVTEADVQRCWDKGC